MKVEKKDLIMPDKRDQFNQDRAHNWKEKFSDMLELCQVELKRTTEIGKKMLSASATNTLLHEKYEDLGKLALAALKDKSLNWENEDAGKLAEQIDQLELELTEFESEVEEIKKTK